jgi:hypothetical protein
MADVPARPGVATAEAGAEATGAGGPARREWLWSFLELFALVGFAIAQPTLDVLGQAPDFFLFRRADRTDILLLVLAVTVLPATCMWLLELVALPAGEAARRAVHLLMVTGLLAVLALEVGKKLTPLRGVRLVALAALGGMVGGLLYAKWPALRLWLRYLAPAPVVFALIFLLVSPVSKLVLPDRGSSANLNAPGVRIQAKTPVVMIFLDEFPLTSLLDSKGRIDRRLYPNFATLAGSSTWYRNATAVSGLTQWAVPAMSDGRYPPKGATETPAISQYPDTMFTLLAKSYDVKPFEVVTDLCPPKTCAAAGATSSTPGGLETTLRDSARVYKRIVWPRDADENPTGAWLNPAPAAQPKTTGLDPSVAKLARNGSEPGYYFDFLNSIKASDRPSFYFLHILLPHQPWHYLPDGVKYQDDERGDGRNANGWTTEQYPPLFARQRHLLQTAEADRLVGQVVARLKSQGLYDKSLLLVTADHGMSFIPNTFARRRAVDRNADQVLWVPLFIKRPGQTAGQVTDRNWEHVDLLPTVADILGIKVPWKVDGFSQAGPEDPRTRSEKWFFSSPGQRQVFPGPPNQAKALKGITDRLLRPDHGYIGWFQFGRYADLVGRRPAQVGVEAASGGSAEVDKLGQYADVDPASGHVPAEVTGVLQAAAGVPARPAVAIAVNGVISAVSETFKERREEGNSVPEGPPVNFAGITDDHLFTKGANRIELFLVDASGGRVRLRPLSVSGS